MYLIYIDDSTERPVNIFSALAIPHERWNDCFDYIKKWRKHLKEVHGIPMDYELHATQFLSGRGSSGVLAGLSRHQRAQIFHKNFKVVEYMDRFGVKLFNVCNADDDQFKSFERLLNRINRTMSSLNSYAHLICDEGKEHQYISMVRRMRVYNPIPSSFGAWNDGASTKNITLDRIIEDPQFKKSHNSYFIQTCDFLAYGLLRREIPTAKARQRRIHRSFDQLDNVLVKACNKNDTHGVIR